MSIVRAALACAFVSVGLAVAGSALAEPTLSFNRDIRPILSDKCFACHGPDAATRDADLRLDTHEGATDWVIVPGDAEGSELIARITSDEPDMVMPPPHSKKPRLTAEEIAKLKQWIDEGASYEAHWAYLPVVPEEVPTIEGDNWSRGPIDKFVLARLQVEGLAPSREADPRVLIRRLFFDLTGLPPSAAEVEQFVNDHSDEAYEKLVDRLLASPQYGERMATWWFDLVRFANTVGYHGDQIHSAIPYRDYVIKSFNENLPFDQFTREQLAGDLLDAPNMWQQVASGYNRLLQTSHEGGIQDKEYLAIHLADRVRNVGEVWLGASTGCAQCHDHKFDPITQKDFYSLGAFFADVDHFGSFQPVGSNREHTERPPEILAWTLPVYEQVAKIDAEIAEIEGRLKRRMPNDWPKQRERLVELKTERAKLEGEFIPALVTEAIEPRTVRVLNRGNWMDDTGEIVAPAVPQFLPELKTDEKRPNRLDLANWLVSGENPLVGRVLANRLWKLFYGSGISPNLIDMGSQSEWPSHPDLLDWLAADIVRSGWDLKSAVKMMVMSSTYRQSSLVSDELEEWDPKNVLLARQSRFRLDAEMIRDSALSVSGLLNPVVGGESAFPYQPAGYYAQLNFPEREYRPSKDEYQYRRGVYTHWQRQFLHPWLLAFDAPSREECTAQRVISNTPSAALVLLNDPSFVEAARALAGRVLTEGSGTDEDQLAWMYKHVLGRAPSDQEVELLAALLEKHRQYYNAHPRDARRLIAIGLSTPVAEVPKPEQAAWTSVCRVLLNLDESIMRD